MTLNLQQRREFVKSARNSGFSYSELAKKLGVSSVTIRKDFLHGREKKYNERRLMEWHARDCDGTFDISAEDIYHVKYLIGCCAAIQQVGVKKKTHHEYLILTKTTKEL